ncbi:MAG: hypothetical protein PHY99_00525 [Bacteroidales bacterium]|nr:hypothetical protein [Bacteroidales bacterium]
MKESKGWNLTFQSFETMVITFVFFFRKNEISLSGGAIFVSSNLVERVRKVGK